MNEPYSFLDPVFEKIMPDSIFSPTPTNTNKHQQTTTNMTTDTTENIRRSQVQEINSQIESEDRTEERKRLESLYCDVWDTDQMSDQFEVLGFMSPYVIVRRKSDDCKGSLQFQHNPRFYFNFAPK